MTDHPTQPETSRARSEPRGSEVDGAGAYAMLLGLDGPDLAAAAPPLHVPRVPGGDYPRALSELRGWVEELMERFGHLDHMVIPVCWWRHNGHVEVLQALRDHERVSYADTAPGSAAMAWQREFFFAEARLREWTAYFGCARDHKPPIRQLRIHDDQAWSAHLESERQRRDGAALASARAT